MECSTAKGKGQGEWGPVTGPCQMGRERRESNDPGALRDRPADAQQNCSERKLHVYFSKKLII